MVDDWVSIVAFCASAGSTLLVSKIRCVNNMITTELLKLRFISPKSSTCKILQDSKPLKNMNAERTILLKDIEDEINLDPNVTMCGFHNEILQVLRGIFRQPTAFFLNSMDAVIITTMGIEVLTLKFPPAKYDRCIHIELTDYRSLMLQFSIISAVAVGVLSTVIVNRREVRSLFSR